MRHLHIAIRGAIAVGLLTVALAVVGPTPAGAACGCPPLGSTDVAGGPVFEGTLTAVAETDPATPAATFDRASVTVAWASCSRRATSDRSDCADSSSESRCAPWRICCASLKTSNGAPR